METAFLTNGQLQVWHSQWGSMQTIFVSSTDEAIKEINKRIASDLLDDSIVFNAFWLEVYEDWEWVEWYNDDGEDIIEVIDNLNDND